jgi:hypothetical protein
VNRLPPHKQEALKAMLAAGGSIRMAVRKLGVGKNTAMAYRKAIPTELYCQCGQAATHKGMCTFRYMSDGYEARRKFMKQWAGSKKYHCVDCGIGRSGVGGSAGLRCKDCYRKHVRARAFAWAAEKKECKICCKENHRTAEGKLPAHCLNEWCQRLYTFYYVEGRSRPPSAQGGQTNGLRFEFLLSDYIRRTAHEKQLSS